jgi:hypothetical protein
MVTSFFSGGCSAQVLRLSDWFAASGGRHAQLLPLAGEEEKSKVEAEERHDVVRA